MECGKNFEIRCSFEEAMKIAKYAEFSIGLSTTELFNTSFDKHIRSDNDMIYAKLCALSDIYILGFISGCRAIRSKRGEHQQKSAEHIKKTAEAPQKSCLITESADSEKQNELKVINCTMTDYKWQLNCLNDRIEHPEKYKGVDEDVDETIAELRKWLAEHTDTEEDTGDENLAEWVV